MRASPHLPVMCRLQTTLVQIASHWLGAGPPPPFRTACAFDEICRSRPAWNRAGLHLCHSRLILCTEDRAI